VQFSVASIVLEASSQANDQGAVPYARWKQSEIVQYLDDALIQVGTFRPDAFAATITVALQAGSQQTLPPGFSFLKSVDANATNSNCPDATIVECDLNMLRAFFKKPCTPTGGAGDYRVRSFAYDGRNPNVFYVSPPVPVASAGLSVTLTAVGEAPQYAVSDIGAGTLVAIDPKYRNALLAWMLYRAYEVDTESVSSRQTKLDNEGLFWKTLGVNYKQESLYRSGWYLGDRGLKDNQPGRH